MKLRKLRVLAVALMVALAPPLIASAADAATPSSGPSGQASCPVLVLSAMPVELDPLLSRAQVDPTPTWVHDGRGFWAGSLQGNKVVMALTGIGITNATDTTTAAFAHFGCFSAVVFSGTSGGDYIGDVMVPSRWTVDGKHFVSTSPSALRVLRRALSRPIALQQTTPIGDPLCLCGATSGLPAATAPVKVTHEPKVEVGGDGLSGDGFGGRALPCSPSASDVFGCWPCPFPDTAVSSQTTGLASTVPPFVDPSFFEGYGAASAAPPGKYVSQDMETAAVFSIAATHGVPVIGFRSASDGGGDPLGLPGFPAEFFFYRQLAADNAASVAAAFLGAWSTANH